MCGCLCYACMYVCVCVPEADGVSLDFSPLYWGRVLHNPWNSGLAGFFPCPQPLECGWQVATRSAWLCVLARDLNSGLPSCIPVNLLTALPWDSLHILTPVLCRNISVGHLVPPCNVQSQCSQIQFSDSLFRVVVSIHAWELLELCLLYHLANTCYFLLSHFSYFVSMLCVFVSPFPVCPLFYTVMYTCSILLV